MARSIGMLNELTKQELLTETRLALKTPAGIEARERADLPSPSRASKSLLVYFLSMYEGLLELEETSEPLAPVNEPLAPVNEPSCTSVTSICTNGSQLNLEPVQETIEVAANDDEPIYFNHDELLQKTAKEYFAKIEKYTLECLAGGVKFSPVFFELVSYFRPDVERLAATSNPYSILNFKAQVLKRIADKVSSVANQYPDDALTTNFELFAKSVAASFSNLSAEKFTAQNASLNNRANNAIKVDVTRLIEWAGKTLTHLPQKSDSWTLVATALMVATGRRQSEIMSSGRFTVSGDKLSFSGQLKRHQDEQNAPIDIPTLVDAQLVINGIQWLDSWRKRIEPADESFKAQQSAAKKAHDKYSRYLSQAAKAVLTQYVDISGDWIHESKDRRKCHLFRQIYGQLAYKRYYANSGRKIGQVLTEILGHADNAGSRKFAAESYDADIFVVND